MSESGPTNEEGQPEEGPWPRRTRNEMIADAFRNKRLPDDWIDEDSPEGADEDDHDDEEEDDGEEADEHDPESEEELEPYLPPEPESHRISATGLKSVACLVGAVGLIVVAVRASLPSPVLVALWLAVLALAGGCLYLLNRLVEEHEREFTVLLPGIGAVVGAIALLIFGHAVDENLGSFFDLTVAAAIAALAYAVWHNRKHFGWGNAIAVTVIELVFTPIAIVLALIYFFRHDIARQVAPGMMPPGKRSSSGGGRTIPEIGSVSQSHETFLVYDESGNLITQMNFNGELMGYTSKSFQVRSGRTVQTFDAFCRPLHSRVV